MVHLQEDIRPMSYLFKAKIAWKFWISLFILAKCIIVMGRDNVFAKLMYALWSKLILISFLHIRLFRWIYWNTWSVELISKLNIFINSKPWMKEWLSDKSKFGCILRVLSPIVISQVTWPKHFMLLFEVLNFTVLFKCIAWIKTSTNVSLIHSTLHLLSIITVHKYESIKSLIVVSEWFLSLVISLNLSWFN